MLPISAATFPAALGAALAREPGRPLVTAYDERDGARTELSVTTYANWVDKTANLLVDEFLLGEGDVIRIELPPHWLSTVFLGAALTAGVAVTTDPQVAAHLVVRGPDRVDDAAPDVPVLACSLTPFATRFDRGLPDGVEDFGALWPGQPDGFLGEPVEPTTTACRQDGTSRSQAALIEEARAVAATWSGDRLLTDVDPLHRCGTTTLLAALVRGGSMVLVGNPGDDGWPDRLASERGTDVLRSTDPGDAGDAGTTGPAVPLS